MAGGEENIASDEIMSTIMEQKNQQIEDKASETNE